MVILIRIFIFMIKKIIYAGFLLYGYNIISVHYSLMIPINYYSLSIVSLLGPFGLIGIVLFRLIVL